MTSTAAISDLLRALADPTRRSVYERIVGSTEITVVELTRGSGVTQGAVSQHLKALKGAGLVAERPEGRNVYYRAEPQGLAPLVDWMSDYGTFWSQRLDALRGLLLEIDPPQKSAPAKSAQAHSTPANSSQAKAAGAGSPRAKSPLEKTTAKETKR